jgi:hypothetical protein
MNTMIAPQTDMDRYLRGKKWYLYLPVWLLGLYIFINLLKFNPSQPLPFIINVAQSFDFFMHEMAHIFTAFLPAILTAAAGSMSELLLGVFLVWGAFKWKTYFTSLIASLWFMLACQSVGIYMADARAQQLSLFSLGAALSGSDKATHDWNFVFGRLNLLPYDTLIGGTVRWIGVVVGFLGLCFSAWLIFKMAIAEPAHAPVSLSNTPQIDPIEWQSADQATRNQLVSQNLYPSATTGPLGEPAHTAQPGNTPKKQI